MMAAIADIITADRVNRFLAKQDGMAMSKRRGAGLLRVLWLLKAHSPARKDAIRPLRHDARVARANAGVAHEVAEAGIEPVRSGENFCVDAGEKSGVR